MSTLPSFSSNSTSDNLIYSTISFSHSQSPVLHSSSSLGSPTTFPTSTNSSSSLPTHTVIPDSSSVRYSTLSPVPCTLSNHTVIKKWLREYKTPAYLTDYVCNSVYLTNLTPSCFEASLEPFVLSFSALSSTNQHFLKSLSHISEPTTYSQVVLHPAWQEAMAK